MQKIIVMNGKGGCGKTTIATNLASFYAAYGYKTSLIDYDPQGSSVSWLKRRPVAAAAIHGVAAQQASGMGATRSWQMRLPHDTSRVIVDTPAAIKAYDVAAYLKDVTTVIVPVLSSVIDVEASTLFLHEVKRVIKARAPQTALVVVASRVRGRSPALTVMTHILADMGIPVAGHLRDTVNYLRCTDLGLGVQDLPSRQAVVERRAMVDLVTSIDPEFRQRQSPASIAHRIDVAGHEVALAIPASAHGRYGLSWK